MKLSVVEGVEEVVVEGVEEVVVVAVDVGDTIETTLTMKVLSITPWHPVEEMKGKEVLKGDLLEDLVALIVVVTEVVSTMRRAEMENAHVEPMNAEVGQGTGKCSFYFCV